MSSTKKCFVISPIGNEGSEIRVKSDLVLHHIIKPVLEKNGYEVNRADNITQPGLITHQIIDELIESDLVIADLSSFNPNVFYELAVRHAAEKPIIHMIGEGENLPFDIANFRTIFYGIRIDQAEKAKTDLDSQVISIINEPFVPNNPIVMAKRFADIQKNLKSDVKTNSQDALILLLNQVSNLDSKFEKLNFEFQKISPQSEQEIQKNQNLQEINQRIFRLSNNRVSLQLALNLVDKVIEDSKSKKQTTLANMERVNLLQKINEVDAEIRALNDRVEFLANN